MAEDQKEKLEGIESDDSKSTEEQVEDALKKKDYEGAKALLAREDFSDEGLRKIGIGVDRKFNSDIELVAEWSEVVDAKGKVLETIKPKVANYERENSDLYVSVEQMVAASHSLKELLDAIKGAKKSVTNITDVKWYKRILPFTGIKDVLEKREFKRNMETVGDVTKHMSQKGQNIFNSIDGDNITPSRGEAAEIAGDVGLTATLLTGSLIAAIPMIGAYVTSIVQKMKSLDDPAQIMVMLDELEEYVQQRYDKLNEVFSGMNSALVDAGVKNLEQLAARAA